MFKDSTPRSRRSYVTAATLAGVALLAGCSSGNAASSSSGPAPYTVYMVADLSGAAASGLAGAGVPGGATTAADVINKAGGINGHPIKIIGTADAMSTSAGAQTAAREAIQAKPDVIFSGESSAEFDASLPLFTAAKLPVFYGTGANELTTPPQPWLFRFIATVGQITSDFVGASRTILGTTAGKKVAFVGPSVPSIDLTIKQLEPKLRAAGATLSTTVRTTLTLTSFTSQAADIASAKPDIVILQDQASSDVLEARGLIAAGYTGPILAGQSAGKSQLVGLAATNVYGIADFNMDLSPSVQAAAEASGQQTAATSAYFGVGWAMSYALSMAGQNCALPCGPVALGKAVEALGTWTPPGDVAAGPMSFSAAKHYALTRSAVVKYDPSTQKIVRVGTFDSTG
ncbi:MAG TPA: ABC transporter substrate-binding protein [Jatrophihabitantaceae bacterium]|jgi:ABC-type branched-subunit amino acid transport system substrate-binding protein|nr:ABC transporter substrate-binding protein [Jatrophihabitantaceae bacterium]